MEPKESNAVVVREAQPLTSSQVLAGLNAIRGVMKDCMIEKQDYGTVPGCGPKPGLFQPGAQKLSMMFQLNPEVREETITDYPNLHRGYRLVVRVTNGTKFADGVGECSTLESKYKYRQAERVCPSCGKTAIIKGKAEYGGGWVCFGKKGGCGEKWADGTEQATAFEQAASKVENENPPDCWNTVRKMAFKRAFVHAIINATNTSELWSQDLEDLVANGIAPQGDTGDFDSAKPQSAPKASKPAQKPSESESGASWRNFRVPFGKNKDVQLGELGDKSLSWYVQNFSVHETYEGKDGKMHKKKPETIENERRFRSALDAAAQEKPELAEAGDASDRIPD